MGLQALLSIALVIHTAIVQCIEKTFILPEMIDIDTLPGDYERLVDNFQIEIYDEG